MAARDAVQLRGGPRWEVLQGRKDSLESSFSGANLFIPAPNSSLEVLIDNFKQQGLDIEDLRIYEAEDEYHHVNDRYKRYTTFRRILRFICPVKVEGRDNKFAPLDLQTPKRFDNQYFINILGGNGLLGSDNVLISQDLDGKITEHVRTYLDTIAIAFHTQRLVHDHRNDHVDTMLREQAFQYSVRVYDF
ncbi:hypothetical protein V8G54_019252 [Vigna mungo]|uniref:peroxidase n=1 Tax=Vigna mungo TaxID=3915 RepID=A0AAQ3NAJ6_VIGMU